MTRLLNLLLIVSLLPATADAGPLRRKHRFRQRPAVQQPAPQLTASIAPTQRGLIDVAQWSATGDGTETRPWTGIDEAINKRQGLRRAVLYFPGGYYRFASTANIPIDGSWKIVGDGKTRSIIRCDSGPAFRCSGPVNSAIGSYLDAEGLCIENTNQQAKFDRSTAGILLENPAYVTLRDVMLLNWPCGVTLDQATHVRIEHCHFVNQWWSSRSPFNRAIWIVCGHARRQGSKGGCTNCIYVTDCAFSGAQVGVVDDGGFTHVIERNTFNVTYPAIYAAGVVRLSITDNYMEAVQQEDATIKIDYRWYDDPSVSVGAVDKPAIGRNYFFSGKYPCIQFIAGNGATIASNFLGAEPGPAIKGANKTGQGTITAFGNTWPRGTTVFDDGGPAVREEKQ